MEKDKLRLSFLDASRRVALVLIAATIVIFVIAYIVFQRQEIRA